MSNPKLLVVVGSGPGIGVSTASVFASRGFSIALLSRNSQRLEEDARAVQKVTTEKHVEIHTHVADVSDHVALKRALMNISQTKGIPEVVLFNAARISQSEIGITEPEFLLDDFKTMNIGLYVTAIWALPLLAEVAHRPETHPSFLISGADLQDHPIAALFSLSMQKAAQFSFAKSLSQVAGLKGVHVGIVRIDGVVSDKNPIVNAKTVAEGFWGLYSQDQESWQLMVDISDTAK